MKVSVTGYRGHVGKHLIRAGFCPLECDTTDIYQVERVIKREKPDLVVHLAGKNNVDWCEDPANQVEAIGVNVMGTGNVFEVLEANKIGGVILSSDQIWRGGWFEGRYKEDSKVTAPVNYYGLTKLSAEAVTSSFGGKIVRTSFLFDRWRREIAERISSLEAGETLSEPTFIKRSFLYLPDFVWMISEYCKRFSSMPDVLHLSGGKTVSWYAFVRELAEVYGFKNVKPRLFESRKYVPRPHNGGLNTELARSLGFGYRDFQTGLRRMRNES